MAESYVEVSEGSGKKLHTHTRTIGSNTVHDEIMLLGEPYLASYSASFSSISAADIPDQSIHLIALMAGSTLRLRVRRIIVSLRQSSTADEVPIEVVRLTAAGSGGTGVTPSPFDPSDAAAGATARTRNTTSGTEGVRLISGINLQAGSASPHPAYEFQWVQAPHQKPIIVPAGTSNGIAIKAVSSVAGSLVSGSIEFDEASF